MLFFKIRLKLNDFLKISLIISFVGECYLCTIPFFIGLKSIISHQWRTKYCNFSFVEMTMIMCMIDCVSSTVHVFAGATDSLIKLLYSHHSIREDLASIPSWWCMPSTVSTLFWPAPLLVSRFYSFFLFWWLRYLDP